MKQELNAFDVILDGQVEIFYLNSKKYNGTIYEEFRGYLASEFEVIDGMKNGYEKIFYSNGTIEALSIYKNGLLSGMTKSYFESGKLQEEAFFELGICLWHKLYHEDGSLYDVYNIDKESSDYKRLEAFRKTNNDN